MPDPRTYIRLHDGMPDHPKVDGLSDRAFRLLVETWCWCSRHLTDGRVPAATWRKRGTAKARAELVDAGLVEEIAGAVMMHDYLEHQRSAAEVREIREARGKGGSFGNHVRWHTRRGVIDPECEHCAARLPDPGDVPDPSQDRSDDRSQDRSQADRSASPETETETETESFRAGVDQSSSPCTGRAPDDDGRDAKLEQHIIGQLAELTGRTVSREHAANVRRKLLEHRQVDNPLAYITAALRGAPRAHLPAEDIPASTPVGEARRAAGATGPGIEPPDYFRAARERMQNGRRSA